MDLSLFSQLSGSVSAAVTLAKSFVGLRDETQRLAVANDLLAQLNEAHGKIGVLVIAEAARATQHEAALREKGQLEEKIRQLEAQRADFERYALQELAPGVLAYALREDHRGDEPMHYICPACRNNGKKSILQRREAAININQFCPECTTTYLESRKPKEAPIPTVNHWMGR